MNGLLEILETFYSNQSSLIQSCIDFLEQHKRFIDLKSMTSHQSIEELLIMPYLKNEDYRNAFMAESAMKTRVKGKLTNEMIASLYLSDPSMASVWHHH